MAQEARVIKVICDHHGCMEYDELLKVAAVEDLENVINNSDIFTVIHQNMSKWILVTPNIIRRCRKRDCQKNCSDLHLCKFDLLGQCNNQQCRYGHSLDSEHNSRVLSKYRLQNMSKDQLRVLLLQNESSSLPEVCISYNKGKGDFGYCPRKNDCDRLHVCEKFIQGLCDSSKCKKCHDFCEPHPSTTLQARGVANQLIGTPLLFHVYRNILMLNDHRNANDKCSTRSKQNPKSNTRGKIPESSQRSTANEICLSFIKGRCKYEDKCWRVHFGIPYKWEVEVDEDWIDLPDNELIERDYSDPARTHSVGREPVCFDTMMKGVHKVRRLSTRSSVIESSFTHTTKWIWYWEDEHSTWIQYGLNDEMDSTVSITSEELEKKYLQFLEDNTQEILKFYAGEQFYKLNFKDMKQRNEMSGKETDVRRRPFFVSVQVQTARPRRGQGASSHTGVPGFWDKTAIPESGFQRISLNPSQKDYVKVQDHFNKTMTAFSILTIERVQNRELWEKFQLKREQMKKTNSDKKYGEAERLLFHSTSTQNVDAICHQNFDMRESRPNGAIYGQVIETGGMCGYCLVEVKTCTHTGPLWIRLETRALHCQRGYFARNASYCHDSTNRFGEKSMFACRVLVGQYTKGQRHYRSPPAKDPAGNLYDSCVNDVREPTIYIVFELSQVYPEFLITYY